MRVNETAAARRPAAGAEPGRFAETLRRARAAKVARESASGPGSGARSAELRKVARDRAPPLAAREAARDEERRLAAAFPRRTPGGAARRLAGAGDSRPLVRALPAAVDAARLRDGAPLSLSFGRSLDVELRAVPAGVEVVLRPEPRLLRAAEAELPRVVEALRLAGRRGRPRRRAARAAAGRRAR